MIKKSLWRPGTTSFLIFVCFIFLGACDNTNPSSIKVSTTATPNNTTDNSLSHFIQQFQLVEPGSSIPKELCDRYIEPILANNRLHPYLGLEKASYNYGQVIYEDSVMVAFTFYYKAEDKGHLMAASFLASFNRPNEQFIDARMVFGSSVFDYQASKGYKMGFSCKSDLEFLESDRMVLKLKSQTKQLYTHFKEGTPPKANVIKTHRYSLLKNGQFVFE
ncbi:hypothetical protein [Aureispira anguillae]|uniref:Lipoprotein n=1 Tax=Aureispira anguillae TaxID=2864201 RepID=A0A916DQI2_9BACT|nr:hypothetical protein [Aureispira anguillae]BDS10731.1 hypothetical protein AsAng_0014400 [Aureispira anguillae]